MQQPGGVGAPPEPVICAYPHTQRNFPHCKDYYTRFSPPSQGKAEDNRLFVLHSKNAVYDCAYTEFWFLRRGDPLERPVPAEAPI